MKPTKLQANYRLPVNCCATCEHSYISSYESSMCIELRSGTEIDAGGVCDHYSSIKGTDANATTTISD